MTSPGAAKPSCSPCRPSVGAGARYLLGLCAQEVGHVVGSSVALMSRVAVLSLVLFYMSFVQLHPGAQPRLVLHGQGLSVLWLRSPAVPSTPKAGSSIFPETSSIPRRPAVLPASFLLDLHGASWRAQHKHPGLAALPKLAVTLAMWGEGWHGQGAVLPGTGEQF